MTATMTDDVVSTVLPPVLSLTTTATVETSIFLMTVMTVEVTNVQTTILGLAMPAIVGTVVPHAVTIEVVEMMTVIDVMRSQY